MTPAHPFSCMWEANFMSCHGACVMSCLFRYYSGKLDVLLRDDDDTSLTFHRVAQQTVRPCATPERQPTRSEILSPFRVRDSRRKGMGIKAPVPKSHTPVPDTLKSHLNPHYVSPIPSLITLKLTRKVPHILLSLPIQYEHHSSKGNSLHLRSSGNTPWETLNPIG